MYGTNKSLSASLSSYLLGGVIAKPLSRAFVGNINRNAKEMMIVTSQLIVAMFLFTGSVTATVLSNFCG